LVYSINICTNDNIFVIIILKERSTISVFFPSSNNNSGLSLGVITFVCRAS